MAGVRSIFSLFRWAGLIPFVVITGGLWLGGYLFADSIARSLLASNLTRIQGAQVDVSSADVSWQPFGIVAEGLQFTDPGQPSRNAVEVARTSFQLDGLALLTGKVVIESLAVDGVTFNTGRTSPGRVVTRAPRVEREGPSSAERLAGTVDLPTPARALEQHGQLAVETRAEEARETRDRAVSGVQARQAELPDQATLDSHRERLQAIQDTQFNSLQAIADLRSEVESLTAAVVRDRQAIDRFIDEVEDAQGDIRAALSALANAPAEDLAALLDTYNLSPDGQVALAGLILGEQWAQWVADGQRWYAMAQPWLARLQDRRQARQAERETSAVGYFVLFPEDNPLPGFWLKEALISASTTQGDWRGRIDDLSSDPALIDRPASANLFSTRLDAADSAELDLIWDRRNGNQLDIDFDIQNWRVSGWLIPDDDLPLGLRSAITQLSLDATYRDNWSGVMSWDFGNVQFGMPDEWRSGNVVRQSLERVDQFRVQSALSGSGVVPRTSWASDLDNQVAGALRDIMGDQVAEWEVQVRAELEQRRAALEAPVRAELTRLDDQRREWTAQKTALENEVLATLDSIENRLASERRAIESRLDAERLRLEEQQRLLEERARQELEAAERRAREEREAAERRAREEAERRARELLPRGGFGF